jgi:hypothetical protein
VEHIASRSETRGRIRALSHCRRSVHARILLCAAIERIEKNKTNNIDKMDTSASAGERFMKIVGKAFGDKSLGFDHDRGCKLLSISDLGTLRYRARARIAVASQFSLVRGRARTIRGRAEPANDWLTTG